MRLLPRISVGLRLCPHPTGDLPLIRPRAEEFFKRVNHTLDVRGPHSKPKREPHNGVGDLVGRLKCAMGTAIATSRNGRMKGYVMENGGHTSLLQMREQEISDPAVPDQQVVHVRVMLAIDRNHWAPDSFRSFHAF